MNTTLGPSPGAARHPTHTVAITPSNRNWTVRSHGRVLAQSRQALLVEETGFPPVTYFPPRNVRTDSMLQSDSRTTCPFKGEAKYFSTGIDGKQTDIAWTYPSVYDEVDAIAGYVAFYADRVEILSESDDDR